MVKETHTYVDAPFIPEDKFQRSTFKADFAMFDAEIIVRDRLVDLGEDYALATDKVKYSSRRLLKQLA